MSCSEAYAILSETHVLKIVVKCTYYVPFQLFLSVQLHGIWNMFLRMGRFLDFDRNLKPYGFHFNDSLKKWSNIRFIWVITFKLSTDTQFPSSDFSWHLLVPTVILHCHRLIRKGLREIWYWDDSWTFFLHHVN